MKPLFLILGLERDKQIAEQCPDIDLVIGGHSHTFLYSGQAPDVEAPQGSYPITGKSLQVKQSHRLFIYFFFKVTQSGGRKVPVVQVNTILISLNFFYQFSFLL